MAEYKRSKLRVVRVDVPVLDRDEYTGDFRAVYVCPYYKDQKECPREKPTKYADNEVFIRSIECHRSPVIRKSDGEFVCMLTVDLNDPNISNTLQHLGDYLEFRKMEE